MKRLFCLFSFGNLFLLITLLCITNNVSAEAELINKYMILQDEKGNANEIYHDEFWLEK